MKEPKWILQEIVCSIHSEQITEHGGGKGIRDIGLLESALEAPRQLFHYKQAQLPKLAATYAYRIIKNHPFIDGNKRTGYIVSRLFLLLNGHDMIGSEEDRITIFMKLANGLISEEHLTEWFESCPALAK